MTYGYYLGCAIVGLIAARIISLLHSRWKQQNLVRTGIIEAQPNATLLSNAFSH